MTYEVLTIPRECTVQQLMDILEQFPRTGKISFAGVQSACDSVSSRTLRVPLQVNGAGYK